MMRKAVCRLTALILTVSVCAPAVRADGGDVPPAESVALLKWLQAGIYKAWPKESAVHRSMGSHQTLVITHLNPPLDKSLASKAASHPKGSAAVKELLDAAGKLSGWAVAIKTATDSDGGKGWYWYEILGIGTGGSVVAHGQGVPLCIGCHVRGRDAVLTEHPLD